MTFYTYYALSGIRAGHQPHPTEHNIAFHTKPPGCTAISQKILSERTGLVGDGLDDGVGQGLHY